MSQRRPRVASGDARELIRDAAQRLLRDKPFAGLTVEAVMAECGLSRTAFYRHFDGLPQLALTLLPDAGDPVVAQARRAMADGGSAAAVQAIVDGLVAVFAEHGPLLGAIDDVVRRDPAHDPLSDPALAEPAELIAELLAGAAHPPGDPRESARLLQAAHRAYLLDCFGGPSPRATPEQARAALRDLWAAVLA